jgi:hypothetical protein
MPLLGKPASPEGLSISIGRIQTQEISPSDTFRCAKMTRITGADRDERNHRPPEVG